MGYLLLAALAATGFAASLACHVYGWLTIAPPWGRSSFVLHAGAIALAVPLIILVNRATPPGERPDLKVLLAAMPRWMRPVMPALFVYAALNFVYFISSTSQYPKGAVPFPIVLRGFSGHWLFFYGAFAVIFVALGALSRQRRALAP